MNFSPHLILLITLLFVGTFVKGGDEDEMIDIDKPETFTFLEDSMFDIDTGNRCYYINQVFLCYYTNEARFNRDLEKKNVGRIQKLRLKNCEIPIDSEFLNKYYVEMEEVYLEDTRPSTLKVDDFVNLNRIVYENCGIDNLNYKMIPHTNHLMDVAITYNRIQHISEVTFARSPRIRKLDLSHNDLRGIDRYAFGKLTELEELRLDHNYLKSLNEHLLDNCTRLQHLNLAHNMLFTLEFYFFDGILNIKSLDISYNPLFNFEQGIIFGSRFKNLTQYKIDGLPCSTLENKLFYKLKRYFYLFTSEKKAHLFQQRDKALCQSGSKACMYYADLLSDVREPLWWEKRSNQILCIDYFGHQWRQSLRPHAQPNITEIAEDLMDFTDFLTQREVYAVELLFMQEFLKKFVSDVQKVHKTIGDIRYRDVYEYDQCYN